MLYTLVVVLSVLALVQSHEGHDHQDEGPAKFHIDPKDEHMKEHLKEHLDEMADDVKLETDNDVYFGYFNVHDNNKDGFLDGLELLNSFADHRVEAHDEGDGDAEKKYEQTLKTYVDVVDVTLKDFDKDNDGFVSFSEYMGSIKGTS